MGANKKPKNTPEPTEKERFRLWPQMSGSDIYVSKLAPVLDDAKRLITELLTSNLERIS